MSAASVRLRFGNAGTATAVFQARATAQDPRCYTVSPGRELSDDWAFTGSYDLAVHGPNGFFRRFAGTATGVRLDVRARYEGHPEEIALEVTNRGTDRIEVHVADRYGSRPVTVALAAGQTRTPRWSLARTRGWYDLTLTVAGDRDLAYRYAGHVEDGADSVSDPGMAGLL